MDDELLLMKEILMEKFMDRLRYMRIPCRNRNAGIANLFNVLCFKYLNDCEYLKELNQISECSSAAASRASVEDLTLFQLFRLLPAFLSSTPSEPSFSVKSVFH